MSRDNTRVAVLIQKGAPTEYEIKEAKSLIEAAGYKLVYTVIQRGIPDSRFYLGRGKVKELKRIIEELCNKYYSLKVIVNDRLKPTQAYNLMRELNVEVMDRVQLILEIFDLHAGSIDAKLQIELARLKHELPLLKEWVRLSKIGELPGFLSSGAYKIDSYYRMVKRRIVWIERKIREMRRARETLRIKRQEHGIPTVSLAGYTSSGKTTLFNTLTRTSRKIGKEPFTTLSPKTSLVCYNGFKFFISDTVGFIDDVPVEIIEAFKSTLEEIALSDLILLLVDISESEDEIIRKLKSSLKTLRAIGASTSKLIIVPNKIDLISEEVLAKRIELIKDSLRNMLEVDNVEVTPISALNGENIEMLKNVIMGRLRPRFKTIKAVVRTCDLGKLKMPLYSISHINGEYVELEVKVSQREFHYVYQSLKDISVGKPLVS